MQVFPTCQVQHPNSDFIFTALKFWYDDLAAFPSRWQLPRPGVGSLCHLPFRLMHLEFWVEVVIRIVRFPAGWGSKPRDASQPPFQMDGVLSGPSALACDRAVWAHLDAPFSSYRSHSRASPSQIQTRFPSFSLSKSSKTENNKGASPSLLVKLIVKAQELICV